MDYLLAGRTRTRHWRRGKHYTEAELRWLARRRGLTLQTRGNQISVLDPHLNKIVAIFAAICEDAPIDAVPNQTKSLLQAYAALKTEKAYSGVQPAGRPQLR